MRRAKVKLDSLIAFMAVAERGNIDSAADELGLSASGVRKQLENIETTFGIRLFESRRGSLALTEDGDAFYQDTKKAVEQVLLAEEQVAARKAINNHHLKIGHSTNLPPKLISGIVEIAVEDNQLVRIEHRSALTSTVVRGVIEGTLHAGFGVLPIHVPELLVRTIHAEPLVACIPTGHRLAAKPAISPQDLDGEAMIAVSREPWPERHGEIEDHFADFGVIPSIVADAYSAPEALLYVEQKVGICLVAASSIVGRPALTVRPLSTHVLIRRCGVFIREDNRSPLLQKFLEISLLLSNHQHQRRGPTSVTARDDTQKVKRIS